MVNYFLWGISFFTLWLTIVWLNFLYCPPCVKKHKKSPKISFLVPAYNEASTIIKTVTSLLEADYPSKKKEIIVINDGSTDKTASVMKEFIKTNPSVKLINKQNGGKSSALNAGLKEATGELIGVVDADSRISPGSIRAMLPHFANKKNGAVISRIRVDNPRKFLEKLQYFEYVMSSMIRKVMNNFGTLSITPGVLSLYRADFVKKTGGFVEDKNNLTEDLEIALRLKAHKYNIHMEPNAITYTNVPPTIKSIWKQRIRWSRGYIYNHWNYRHMFFSKKHGLFGVFMLPVNVVAVLILLINIMFITYSAFDHWSEFLIRSFTIPNYFWNTLTSWPTLKEFILARSIHVTLPLTLVVILGIYMIVYAHRYFKENLRQSIIPALAYTFVMPYFSTVNWITSIANEVSKKKRKW